LKEKLTTALGEQLANYIILYRQYGPANNQSTTPPATGGSNAGAGRMISNAADARMRGAAAVQTSTNQTPSGVQTTTVQVRATTAPTGGGNTNVQASRTAVQQILQRPAQGGGGAGGAGGGGNRPQNISSLYQLINSSVSVPDPNNPQAQPQI